MIKKLHAVLNLAGRGEGHRFIWNQLLKKKTMLFFCLARENLKKFIGHHLCIMAPRF